MTRIGDVDLARLKREVSIRQLAEEYGIKLKCHGGKNWIGLCPFHPDKQPSFVASEDSNLWNCLGACESRGGSVIDFVMQAEKLDFLGAVRLLWKRFPTLAPAQRPKRSTGASKPSVPRQSHQMSNVFRTFPR